MLFGIREGTIFDHPSTWRALPLNGKPEVGDRDDPNYLNDLYRYFVQRTRFLDVFGGSTSGVPASERTSESPESLYILANLEITSPDGTKKTAETTQFSGGGTSGIDFDRGGTGGGSQNTHHRSANTLREQLV